MFESEDWDVDENFLNDVDDKAIKFYSQVNSNVNDEVNHQNVKRPKLEISDDSIFSSEIFDQEWNAVGEDSNNTSENKDTGNRDKNQQKETSRKDFILGIFKQNSSKGNSSFDSINALPNSCNNSFGNLADNHNASLPKKNLMLISEILNNTDTKDKQNTLNSIKHSNVQESTSTGHNGMKSNPNHKFQVLGISSRNDSNVNQGKFFHKNINQQIQKTCKDVSTNCNSFPGGKDDNKENPFQNHRKQLLHKTLAVNEVNSTKDFAKYDSVFKTEKFQPSKKMALVRRFPGPAGLLPDIIDNSVPPISYLNSLDENENDKMKEPNESSVAEYYSQNTKNLFTEGAWQSMLNDLPEDFLKGYEIATIKQIANTHSHGILRVPYLAGILEYIDHNPDNPRIVIKDFTDNIQGILHCDIPLKYPDSLETNVVILLRDVGMLRTSSSSMLTSRYHILISPTNLLAIYSNKGETIYTPEMKAAFPDIVEKKQKQRSDNSLNSSIQNTSKNNPETITSDSAPERNIIAQNKNLNSNRNNELKISGETDDSDIDFGDISIMNFSEITNSQNKKNFINTPSKEIWRVKGIRKSKSDVISSITKKGTPENTDRKRENLMQALKKFSPTNTVQKVSPISVKAKSHTGHLSISSDVLEDSLSVTENKTDREPKILQNIKTSPCKQGQSTTEQGISSFVSKLSRFRNHNESVPREVSVSEVKEKGQQSTHTQRPVEDDILKNALTENDSDDEIMSQLDVDSIFTCFNQND